MTMNQVAEASRTRARLSVRAVLGGAIVELVTIGLLLMLAGGLGLWPMGSLDSAKMSEVGAGFAVFAGAAWIAAAFFGGYIASVISRAADRRDGALHGLMSWAIACATGAVLACTWFMAALAVDLVNIDLASAMGGRIMIAFFIGDLLALTAALAGGVVGARAEARLSTSSGSELRRPLTTPALAPQHRPGPVAATT